jgi:hypothetical protein
VKDASLEQIAALPGFSTKTAQKVIDSLHGTDGPAVVVSLPAEGILAETPTDGSTDPPQ